MKNRFFILTATLFMIGFIGFLDFITGEELSFSIFYIIPIALLAIHKDTGSYLLILCSGFASLVWFYSEFETREYSSILFPVWNAFVRLSIFMLVGYLILYLKEKDKRLNKANETLKALNEEKNKFIGIAAHDLRSPISGISALSDLIINYNTAVDSKKDLELLNMIKTLSNNSLIVLKNLLDVSKIESGKIELHLSKGDYINFIKQQVALAQILASPKEIKIKFESSSDAIFAVFDQHYLSEVIDNLLSNAIKYSYRGSEIQIRISVPDHQNILTEVIDRGKGIPSEEQQNLFSYFQKTSSRPTGGEPSSGLGLAIAKRILMLHKGEIGVKSFADKGSNFYFKIPIDLTPGDLTG